MHLLEILHMELGESKTRRVPFPTIMQIGGPVLAELVSQLSLSLSRSAASCRRRVLMTSQYDILARSSARRAFSRRSAARRHCSESFSTHRQGSLTPQSTTCTPSSQVCVFLCVATCVSVCLTLQPLCARASHSTPRARPAVFAVEGRGSPQIRVQRSVWVTQNRRRNVPYIQAVLSPRFGFV